MSNEDKSKIFVAVIIISTLMTTYFLGYSAGNKHWRDRGVWHEIRQGTWTLEKN